MKNYKGFQILKIEGIGETIWSVKKDGETIQRFTTRKAAMEFINSMVDGE